jgi:hypothetical protein
MTVTVSGTTTVITVGVGLPTPELSDLLPNMGNGGSMPTSAPDPQQGPPQDQPITFTPIPGATDVAPAPTARAKVLREMRGMENRWIG